MDIIDVVLGYRAGNLGWRTYLLLVYNIQLSFGILHLKGLGL